MTKKTLKIKISGLHCRACEILSEAKLSALPGVTAVRVSQRRGQAEIDYTNLAPDLKIIRRELQALGYDLITETAAEIKDKRRQAWRDLGLALIVVLIIAGLLKISGLFQGMAAFGTEALSFGGVWLVGLVAGFSTCMALVGGIVIALAAAYAERHPEASRIRKFQPHLYFNLGRVLGFFILGGLLGIAGVALKISPLFNAWLTLIIGLVIICLGLQILEIFPVLQRFSLTLPKSFFRLIPINFQSKKYRPLGALVAGTLSFFLPCGFTQAMQIYALGSGNFLKGGLIMSIFALGTAVGLLGLGGLVSLIKGRRRGLFLKIAGLIVIAFGLLNFRNAYQLLRFQTETVSQNKIAGQAVIGDVQIIKMEQNGNGYSPNHFQVEVNRPVRWIIKGASPYSCASSLSVPALKINQHLKTGENIIEFTPVKTGLINFSCAMGMYTGVIEVINQNGTASADNSASANSGSSRQNLPVCNLNGCH